MRTAVILFALASSVFAQVVAKDHVTDPTLWGNRGVARNVYVSSSSLSNGVAASSFTGNGGYLQTLGGIFTCDLGGTYHTGQWWTYFDYDVAFYPDAATFSADPYGENSASGAVRVLAAPLISNPAIQLGTWFSGATPYHLTLVEVDVSAAGIQTTPGGQHLVALLPAKISSVSTATSGLPAIAFSEYGPGAVGASLDWYKNVTMGPGTLQALGAPHNHVAVRVVLSTPGQPNSSAARLEFDGVSTGALPGPFFSTLTRGQSSTIDFYGDPNQPYILAGSLNLNSGGLIVPGLGSLDIGTPPLLNDIFFIFDGTSPQGALYTLDGMGEAHLSFTVPLSFPTGPFLSVQAAMLQAQPVSSFVFSAAHTVVVQ
jgi:hypothetical protein